MKTMALRLDDSQASTLEFVARVNDTTLTDVVREAIDQEIRRQRNDPAFQARLTQYMAEEQAVLEALR